MAKRSNVIVINGRNYDASTGELIKDKSTPDVPHRVDGFAKPKKSSRPPEKGKILSPKAVKKEVHRRAKNAQELHETRKKSATLVRSATTKPKKKSIISKIVTPANSVAKKADENTENKPLVTGKVPESRIKHAQAIAKSGSISRFGDIQPTKSTTTKATDNQRLTNISKPAPQKSVKSQLIAAQMAKVSSAPAKKSGSKKSNKKRKRTKPFGKTASRLKRNPKVTTIVATSLAAVMLFGYITYLNIPNMAMRVAAAKAGFEASMPGYNPNGFKFSGPIAYSPGQITIQFSSNTDDREYNITERQTAWDSQSLLDNYVKTETGSDSGYSTFRDRGLTVYVYNGSEASWVNGGVWYTIDGDSLLNSEQLLRIAASL